jgi:hypothetical protein
MLENLVDTWQVLFRVPLHPNRHHTTGRTVHYIRGGLAPPPAQLHITEHKGGYYLLYLAESGDELTDTYHETLESAFEQAEFEFNVRREDWIGTAE